VPLCNQAALRIRTGHSSVGITDLIQGEYRRDINSESGDFIVLRADGLHAYPLAVVIDDNWQGVTGVIRGADLLETTPEQVWLQTLLGLPHPVYGHVPVVLGPDGKKLSKSDAALDALLGTNPSAVLIKALHFLNHPVPAGLKGAPPADIIDQAIGHWELARIPRLKAMPYPD
jgi:glutamyl-Q tRNA(Asp) synthetase